MLRRIVIISLSAALLLSLAASIGLWFFLSSWVPTAGKALLIEELQRRAPVSVSIGTMRYAWLRDVTLTDVAITGRDTEEIYFKAPTLNIDVRWLTLALRKALIFRMKSPAEAPCRTDITLSGRYDLKSAAFALHAQTESFSLDALSPWVRKRLPPSLTGGSFRLKINAQQSKPGDLLVAVNLTANEAAWSLPAGRAMGQLAIDATARPPQEKQAPWQIEADAAIKDASAAGLPNIGSITDIKGKGRYAAGVFTISALSASALKARWDGEATLTGNAYEFFISTTRAPIAPFLEAAPEINAHWKAEGSADLRAVCRGNLGITGLPDCLIEAALQRATLSGETLSHPAENLNGQFRYALLEKKLAIEDLHAQILNEPLAVKGTVAITEPIYASLRVQGTLPLEIAKPWLPEKSPVADMGGIARLDLQMDGPVSRPRLLGKISFEETHAAVAAAAITELSGRISFLENQTAVESFRFKINGHPLNLSASLTPPLFSDEGGIPEMVRLSGAVASPEGRYMLRGRLNPNALFIDESQLTLDQTRVRIAGSLALDASRPSQLQAAGVIALEELPRLPFDAFHRLEAFKARGLTDVDVSLRGPLNNFAGMEIEGRLRGDALQIRAIPFNEALCTFEQHQRVIRIGVPYAKIGGGKFVGNYVSEPRQSVHVYRFQADLIGLQLDQLKAVIPAWRKRAVTGQASSHAVLSGINEQPSSWIGEGWLNAQGTDLADLPLLDKLFRGLFGMLADRLGGLEGLRKAQITQAACSWQLARQRIHTQDLRLGGLAGTEPVAIYAKGSVGFDQTLDFTIDPEFSEAVMLEAPTTSTIANTILRTAGTLDRIRRLFGRNRLTGTVAKPEYRFELGPQEALRQVAPAPANILQQGLQGIQGILDAVAPPQDSRN